MTTRTRRPAPVLAILAVVVAVAACTPNDGAESQDPTAAPPTTAASASPAPTHLVSSEPVEPGRSAAPTISQTDTDWGRIWDAVPAGFPRYPGATIADDATPDPVSAAYAIPQGDPAEVAEWMQTSLEVATYSTEALSGPLEDGSFVIDSVGEADCRIQTTIAPLGDLILVTVRYGAACPA